MGLINSLKEHHFIIVDEKVIEILWYAHLDLDVKVVILYDRFYPNIPFWSALRPRALA